MSRPWSQIPNRARGWCLTVNNWTIKHWCTLTRKIKYDYMIIGYEVAPKTGTKHLQVYLYNRNKVSKNTLKQALPHAHIEDALGTPKQNITYCSKGGIFLELGKQPVEGKRGKPEQGKRTDLDRVKSIIDLGGTLHHVANLEFNAFCRYYKSFQKYMEMQYVHRTGPPKIIWIFGPTGCGKTRFATELCPDSFYMKPVGKWWDGYTQQKVLIIDDFDGSWPFRDFLKVLDRYPYIGQTKGGTLPINSPVTVITCDRSIEDVFSDKDDHEVEQLVRRVREFGQYIKMFPDGSTVEWQGEPTEERELTRVVHGEI